MSATEQATAVDHAALARRLEAAWTGGATIEQLSATDGITKEDAYRIQQLWTEQRVAAGETVAGRKIGLTSAAIRRMAGVDEPDYGTLWGSRQVDVAGGRAEVATATFIQPRVEAELAFLLSHDLTGGRVTPQQALAATEAVAVSIEIIDSRIRDWKVAIADTIADNASYGGFVLGPWSRALRFVDLGALGMVVHKNGAVVTTGAGVDSLLGPARAVAWLANTLHELGETLDAGSVVLSGSLGAAIDAAAGDVFTLRTTEQPPLTVRFT